MLKKIVINITLLSIIMLNNSCYFSNYNFKGDDNFKTTDPVVFLSYYDIKLTDTKIDYTNKNLIAKVLFLPKFQQTFMQEELESSANRASSGIVFFLETLIKVPLFILSLFLFGTEANKGNINPVTGTISALFLLDFISWIIISAFNVPTNYEYHLAEVITDRDDLNPDNYEILVNSKLKINCHEHFYNIYSNGEGMIKITPEDIKESIGELRHYRDTFFLLE